MNFVAAAQHFSVRILEILSFSGQYNIRRSARDATISGEKYDLYLALQHNRSNMPDLYATLKCSFCWAQNSI